jgi:ligand-binding sensor domain-containing protein
MPSTPKTGKFRAFTMQDGLPSNAVVSLVNDDAGRTWLGTYGGISCFRCLKTPLTETRKSVSGITTWTMACHPMTCIFSEPTRIRMEPFFCYQYDRFFLF